jgi:hypothetical protein
VNDAMRYVHAFNIYVVLGRDNPPLQVLFNPFSSSLTRLRLPLLYIIEHLPEKEMSGPAVVQPRERATCHGLCRLSSQL